MPAFFATSAHVVASSVILGAILKQRLQNFRVFGPPPSPCLHSSQIHITKFTQPHLHFGTPSPTPPLPRYGPLTITLTLHVAGLLIVVATIAGLKAAFVAVAMATMAFEVGGPETGGVTARAATGGATTIASRRSDRNRIRG